MLLVVNFFWWVSEYLLFYSLYFYEYIKYSRIFKNIYLKHQKGLKKKKYKLQNLEVWLLGMIPTDYVIFLSLSFLIS